MRLTFEIENSTHVILAKHLKHGMRKYIYKALIEGFAAKLEEDRGETLAAVVTRHWDIEEFLVPNKERKDEH